MADTPRATLGLLERRTTVAFVAVLLGLSALAWIATVRTAGAMHDMVLGLSQVGGRMPNDMAPAIFFAMWVAMMVAMMVPTVVPMALAHRMVTRRRGDGPVATAAFLLGYLLVWTAAGVVPLAVFAAFRGVTGRAEVSWLSTLSGAVLIVAGAYQFTPWKTACLRACRTPLSFLTTHDFRRGARGALRAGASHGAWCLGCCWALMAVLAVVGLMNLVWMGAIALVFLAEKTWRRGPMLTKVAGAAITMLGMGVIIWPDLLVRLGGGTNMGRM